MAFFEHDKMNYAKVVVESLRFGFNPKNFILFFVVDVLAAAALLAYAASGSLMSMSPAALLPIASIILVWFLLRLFAEVTAIRMAAKPKLSLMKAIRSMRTDYIHYLAVAIVLTLLSYMFNIVEPFVIGPILSIITSLLFLFAGVSVIIDKNGLTDALYASLDIVRRGRWPYVILAWLILSFVSTFVLSLFLSPTFIIFNAEISQFITTGTLSYQMIFGLLQKLHVLAALLIVGVVGLAISSAAKASFLALFYKQLKTKKKRKA